MADFASNLKSVAEKSQHIWLADPQAGNGQTYEGLAKPGVLSGIKQAGIGHVFVDLPQFVGFVNDALVDGTVKPEQLVQKISENPSYQIYAGRAETPAKPEAIATLMQRAHAANVQLHFTGNAMLEGLNGTQMQGTVEAEYIRKNLGNSGGLGGMFSGVEGTAQKRQEFMQQQMAISGSVVSRTAEGIIASHRQQLEGAVGEVKSLPEGERALIVQQANPHIGVSVESMLGADKVSRIEANEVHVAQRAATPSGPSQQLRSNGP